MVMSQIHLRPIEEADFDAVLALRRRSQSFDQLPEIMTMEELRVELDGAQTDLATDTRLASIDSDVAGYVQTFYLPSEVRLERCYLFGQVDPEHRGKGVGRTLLRWAMERAGEQLRSSGSALPKYLRVDQYDFVESAHRLFARMGFAPVRYYVQLLRPLTDLPSLPHLDGIRIAPWPVDRSEEIRQVKNSAFTDHWGSTPTSPALWEQMTAAESTRLEWSFVALNYQDQIVGYALNERYVADDELLGRQDAWIGSLGTLSDYRHRGIASGLIARSLTAFAEAGLTHASIGVDSASPTGASRLYRSLGFEPKTRTITHEIQL